MEIDDKGKEQLVKLLTVAGPLYTTSLAICYDVGFFYGLDLGFFTFYSITEHLVFALQALPWALIPALSIFGLVYILWWGYHRNRAELAAFLEKLNAFSSDERGEELRRLKKQVNRNKWVTAFVWMVILVMAGISLKHQSYTTAFLVLVSQTISQFAFAKSRLDIPLVRGGLIGVLICVGWITGFLLGRDRSADILQADAPLEVLHSEAGEQKIRIIRSGEKGLLYKSFGTNKPTFLRWDSIKKIEVL